MNSLSNTGWRTRLTHAVTSWCQFALVAQRRLITLLSSRRACPVPFLLFTVLGIQIASVLWFTNTLSYSCDAALLRQRGEDFSERIRSVQGLTKPGDLEPVLNQLAQTNPLLRVYLIDTKGQIKVTAKEYGAIYSPWVATEPVRQALKEPNRTVHGEDPHEPTIEKPIHVSYVSLGGVRALLYFVMLDTPSCDLSSQVSVLTTLGTVFITSFLLMLIPAVFILTTLFTRLNALYHNVSAITHDLKGPLTSIQGYLETYLQKTSGKESSKASHFLQIALRSTESAKTLVNDLHLVNKLEASGEGIQKEAFSLSDLVMDVELSFQHRFKEKGVRLTRNIPSTVPLVLGEISLVERMIRNLVENSLRYTDPGGSVSITLTVKPSLITLAIADTGCGIPKSEIQNIYKPYVRGSNTQGTFEGSGVGLSIARSVAILHGSELQIESEQDKGTCVTSTWHTVEVGGRERKK